MPNNNYLMSVLRSLPKPDYSVNVESLAQAENAEAKTVLSAMRKRSADHRLAAQEAAQAAMIPSPGPQHHHHPRRHHHQHQHSHHRRKRSAGGVSLPPAQPSPLKQAQILRQRKESTASMARATLEIGSGNDYFGGGGGGGRAMPEVEGSEGGGEDALVFPRETARHLALQAASEGVGKYSTSDSCSDWTRCIAVLAPVTRSCRCWYGSE